MELWHWQCVLLAMGHSRPKYLYLPDAHLVAHALKLASKPCAAEPTSPYLRVHPFGCTHPMYWYAAHVGSCCRRQTASTPRARQRVRQRGAGASGLCRVRRSTRQPDSRSRAGNSAATGHRSCCSDSARRARRGAPLCSDPLQPRSHMYLCELPSAQSPAVTEEGTRAVRNARPRSDIY